VGGADAARAYAERGFQFVMVSNDATMFGQAAADLHRAIVDGG
jgi:2-keto-3-deoxy-L-rhamnonate aldolase RhmA